MVRFIRDPEMPAPRHERFLIRQEHIWRRQEQRKIGLSSRASCFIDLQRGTGFDLINEQKSRKWRFPRCMKVLGRQECESRPIFTGPTIEPDTRLEIGPKSS
jgi:hypothetical protein